MKAPKPKTLDECQADAILLADVSENACQLDNDGHSCPALLELIQRTAATLADNLEALGGKA